MTGSTRMGCAAIGLVNSSARSHPFTEELVTDELVVFAAELVSSMRGCLS
jgi:hypothetical protein